MSNQGCKNSTCPALVLSSCPGLPLPDPGVPPGRGPKMALAEVCGGGGRPGSVVRLCSRTGPSPGWELWLEGGVQLGQSSNELSSCYRLWARLFDADVTQVSVSQGGRWQKARMDFMSIDVHGGDADCLFLQSLLLCCGASLPFHSFIPAPVPLFCPHCCQMPSVCPGHPRLSRCSISPAQGHQPSILQHHVLWEMAKGAAADV